MANNYSDACSPCPVCTYLKDTPNHYYVCEQPTEKENTVPDPLPQLPRKTPDEAYEEYKEFLETDGELDPEKVKELVRDWDWLYRNYDAILQSELQDGFSIAGTHASWVVAAIEEKFVDGLMYDVEELLDHLKGGGYMGKTEEETVREFFGYDQWKEQHDNR